MRASRLFWAGVSNRRVRRRKRGTQPFTPRQRLQNKARRSAAPGHLPISVRVLVARLPNTASDATIAKQVSTAGPNTSAVMQDREDLAKRRYDDIESGAIRG